MKSQRRYSGRGHLFREGNACELCGVNGVLRNCTGLPSQLPIQQPHSGGEQLAMIQEGICITKVNKTTHTGLLYNPTGIWLLNTGQHTPAQHFWQLGNGALSGKENQKGFPFISSIGVMGHQSLSCLSSELISWKLFPLELTFLSLFQSVWF